MCIASRNITSITYFDSWISVRINLVQHFFTQILILSILLISQDNFTKMDSNILYMKDLTRTSIGTCCSHVNNLQESIFSYQITHTFQASSQHFTCIPLKQQRWMTRRIDWCTKMVNLFQTRMIINEVTKCLSIQTTHYRLSNALQNKYIQTSDHSNSTERFINRNEPGPCWDYTRWGNMEITSLKLFSDFYIVLYNVFTIQKCPHGGIYVKFITFHIGELLITLIVCTCTTN